MSSSLLNASNGAGSKPEEFSLKDKGGVCRQRVAKLV